MLGKIKKILYFPIASYFRFFAKIRLNRWKPYIIAVTGSSGKTTLLHLIEAQIGNKAKYSHNANSSFGIPFDILGLKRKTLTPDEWLYLFILAPFKAFKKIPYEKIYVAEADCDRPNEGRFLSELLKPNITLWISLSNTHAANFDKLLILPNRHSGESDVISDDSRIKRDRDSGQARMTLMRFVSVHEAIAYEFGYFLQNTSDLVILNKDSEPIKKQASRSKAEIKYVSSKDLNSYKLSANQTKFIIKNKTYSINAILPKEVAESIQMTITLLEYLKIKPDDSFSAFKLPPGRGSIFKGIKNTIIIDSAYNATPGGTESMLKMFEEYPADTKWLVLGDMIELGEKEKEEHEKLADLINSVNLNKIILVGPRLSKYTFPKLNTVTEIQKFLMPKDTLDYILKNIKGKETILFKGARFLEGIIEHLLFNKNDINNLPRREKVWQERRKKWGL